MKKESGLLCRIAAWMLLPILCLSGTAWAETGESGFLLSPEQAEISRLWEGENTDALAAVMRKAERKETVTIAVIGGSITEGTISRGSRDAEIRTRKPYAEIFFSWWRETFPETEFRFINAGIGATNSYLGVHRVQRDVLDQKPDLVLVEFSVNDEASMTAKTSYDNLVRSILRSDSAPAVILLIMSQSNGAGAQVPHAAVGKHYALPTISYKNVIEALMAAGIYSAEELSGDVVHPSALGHRVAGELIIYRLQEVYGRMESAAEPAPFDTAPATKDKYRNARILNARNLVPDTAQGFREDRSFPRMSNGWRSAGKGARLSFTGTFSNLGIAWLRRVGGENGKAEIYVDGVRKATLDADFPDGWGDYAETREIFTSHDAAEHLVEAVIPEDSDGAFTLLGFLLSD